MEFAHNSLPVASTSLSPFQSVCRYWPPSPGPPVSFHLEEGLDSSALHKRGVPEIRQLSSYSIYSLVVQKVWLSTQDLPMWGECCKLTLRFLGHFLILKISNPAAFPLHLPCTMRPPHFPHLPKKAPQDQQFGPPSNSPSPPRFTNGGPVYSFVSCWCDCYLLIGVTCVSSLDGVFHLSLEVGIWFSVWRHIGWKTLKSKLDVFHLLHNTTTRKKHARLQDGDHCASYVEVQKAAKWFWSSSERPQGCRQKAEKICNVWACWVFFVYYVSIKHSITNGVNKEHGLYRTFPQIL